MGSTDDLGVTIFLVLCTVVGLIVTAVYYRIVVQYDREAAKKEAEEKLNGETTELKSEEGKPDVKEKTDHVFDLVDIIHGGANDFLYKEYSIMVAFVFVFAIVILVFTGWKGKTSFKPKYDHTEYDSDFVFGAFSALAFVWGAVTSMFAGYVGMYIATVCNGRVTMKCWTMNIGSGFSMAIQGGMVMGFGLTAIGLANLLILLGIYKLYYKECEFYNSCDTNTLYDALAAYGLGGSSIAMFGRVGGGIYTKAADVGADLVGKLDFGLEEDDPKNPATIADNVGDNVGDIAGMGSDLFGSFAEGTCAAMVILASSNNCVYWTDGSMYAMASNFPAMCFPMAITAAGLVMCFITSLFATTCSGVEKADDVEGALKKQLVISTVLMTPAVFGLAAWLLPEKFWVAASIGVKGSDPSGAGPHKAVCESNVWRADISPAAPYAFGSFATSFTETVFTSSSCLGSPGVTAQEVLWWHPAICVVGGLWAGLLIGYITERYTSNTYMPVKEVAWSCRTGAATNIIYGLALGYNSVVIPVLALAASIYAGFALANMFGVACAALGMMGTMAICLTIDGYGPISDNAGGIAEMCELPPGVRQLTDALDAAGNTTAAIGKGFAIGSAAMVALALFGGYCTRADIKIAEVSVLEPMTFFGLLAGSMLPYWFSAMTMRAVGEAAEQMVQTCKRQFQTEEGKKILAGEIKKPDKKWYEECITEATQASLSEMGPPSALVMLSPLIVGIFLGKFALSGLLVGGIVSGVQMALSASNTGGAWDNAKKYIEAGKYGASQKPHPDEEVHHILAESMVKGTHAHQAAVVGDTVGDPLKDTSGPAINILMKLMAIIALVFAPFIAACRDGYGLIGCSLNKNCNA
jgi:inorganic pyrophosphatase